MNAVNDTVTRYFDVWNEEDPQRRAELIERTWSDDAAYLDPLLEGNGQHGIQAMVEAVHQQFPGHRFRLAGEVDAHHDRIRFAWKLVEPEAGVAVIEGIDFGIVASDGRLRSITGFIDKAPAMGIPG